MDIIHNENRLEHYLATYRIADCFSSFPEYRTRFQLVRFHPKELLYPEKEAISQVYFFISGHLKICANLSSGQTLLLRFYNSFHFIGDLELYEMASPANTIEAATECLCIAFSIAGIRQRLFSDTRFLNFISRSLAEKLAASSQNSAINILYPLEKKLASYIYVVGTRKKDGNGRTMIFFDENLTLTSELLGTSYRHLHRTLREFLNNGILGRQGSAYIVSDEAALQELASDLYM